MSRVLVKLELDGTEVRSVVLQVTGRESMIRQASDWRAETREGGGATLFRVLVYEKFFDDYIDLLDDYQIKDRDKFRLLFNTGQLVLAGRNGGSPAIRNTGVYRMKGVVGDTKFDLEIDKPLAGILLVGALAVGATTVASAVSGSKAPVKSALGMFGAIMAKGQLTDKKSN